MADKRSALYCDHMPLLSALYCDYMPLLSALYCDHMPLLSSCHFKSPHDDDVTHTCPLHAIIRLISES